jgi:hypothetical protein
MSVLADIIAGVLQGGLEGLLSGGLPRRRAPPPLPTEPTPLEMMGMVFGVFIIFMGLIGLAIFVVQWKQERFVHTEPASTATIVAIEKSVSNGSNSFADVRLDYERQTSKGSVACRRSLARLKHGGQDLEVGQTVEVYPQPGSCSNPYYAPDIGNPRSTLIASMIAFPIGIAMLCTGYSLFRRRQRRIMISLPVGAPAPAR